MFHVYKERKWFSLSHIFFTAQIKWFLFIKKNYWYNNYSKCNAVQNTFSLGMYKNYGKQKVKRNATKTNWKDQKYKSADNSDVLSNHSLLEICNSNKNTKGLRYLCLIQMA